MMEGIQLNLWEYPVYYRLVEVIKVGKFGIENTIQILKFRLDKPLDKNKLIKVENDLYMIKRIRGNTSFRNENLADNYMDAHQVNVSISDLINSWYQPEIKFCIA
ncbi:hypothetical protein [Weissella kandleri]|uniref:hypothetical protein n=1 Tax=Weissella kandleri TaxID=1616 RepID=UPI00070F14C4|nr:hypothetical protein [Weissella kandleri]